MDKTKNKFAVIRTGGKQYRVAEGDVIEVEKVKGETGNNFADVEVLLYVDGEKVEIGKPVTEKARIKAKILDQTRDKKIVIFKYKAKKNYRVKTGHRQSITKLQIESISLIK